MCIEGVTERGTPRVVHDHRQIVFGGHTWAEHVLVPAVTVERLVVQIQRPQPGVAAQVKLPGIVYALMGASLRTITHPTCGGVLRSIELHSATRVDLLRRITEPPVDKIEMVRRLVKQQPTGIGLVPMPATEVISTVCGVEYPFKRDRQRGAYRAALDQLLQRGVSW